MATCIPSNNVWLVYVPGVKGLPRFKGHLHGNMHPIHPFLVSHFYTIPILTFLILKNFSFTCLLSSVMIIHASCVICCSVDISYTVSKYRAYFNKSLRNPHTIILAYYGSRPSHCQSQVGDRLSLLQHDGPALIGNNARVQKISGKNCKR